MRILFITETVPYPLDTGGRIKTWHTLTALAREHEVHLHAFVRDPAQREAATGPLGTLCASVTLHLVPRSPLREGVLLGRSLTTGLPFTVGRHYAPGVMTAIARARRQLPFDVVYCDHLSMLEYGRRLDLPIVHDAHNVEHRIVQRFAGTLPRAGVRRVVFEWEGRRLQTYEQAAYRRCALIFAVSDVDAATIAGYAPDVPVVAVPIAVAAAAVTPVETLTEAPEVLFVGTLDWPPNAEAVRFLLDDIWPRVRREVPDARLTIVGRGARPGDAGRDPSVRFTGWVPDVEPWFRQSRVMVVPLRSGSGMRVKILDAFARGVPVVSTAVGIEGIAAVDGRHALIADDPDAFAQATVQFLRSRTLAGQIARDARTLALERYDTGVVGERQLKALRGLSRAA
jgi:polysaccharide biosynthesis protein PslH